LVHVYGEIIVEQSFLCAGCRDCAPLPGTEV